MEQSKNRELILIAAIIIIAAIVIFYYNYSSWFGRKTAEQIDSFDKCLAAGYSVTESYPRKCTGPDGTVFVENPQIISGTNSLLYENKEFNFQIWYPQGSKVKNENYEGYLHVTAGGTTAFAAFLPESLFSGTNLTEAGVVIGVSTESSAIQKCKNPFDPSEITEGTVSIGGNLFSVFDSKGAAAGNIYDSRLFRAIYNGSCYEIVELLHSGNIGNYPTGTVKEFDRAKFSGILEKMVQTFRFTGS